MKATLKTSRSETEDILIKEIWRVKDEQSAARGHDVHRLFAEARKKQNSSRHPRAKSLKQAPSIHKAMGKGEEKK